MQETQERRVPPLGQEDTLKEEMATHFISISIFYSCLENSMDSGAWGATVHGVPKSQYSLVTEHASTEGWEY